MQIENHNALRRVAHAVLKNLLSFDDKKIVLMRPEGVLPDFFTPDKTVILHSFFPSFLAYQRAGYQVFDDIEALKPHLQRADFAIVNLSSARMLNEEMIALALEFLNYGATLIVEGEKNKGVGALFLKAQTLNYAPHGLTKFHGKLFWFAKQNHHKNEKECSFWPSPVQKMPENMTRCAGVFSAKHIDSGSRLLGRYIQNLSGNICDLGAGWGYLSQKILTSSAVKQIDLIEAEKNALNASQQNINDLRARFFWADVLEFTAQNYDYVVSNPPFHLDGILNIGLGRAFIAKTAKILKPNGHFYMVANKHLAYEKTLNALFQKVKEIDNSDGYKVIKASFPK